MKMRIMQLWLAACSLYVVTACGGSSATSGLGSANQLTGTVFAPSGTSAVAGATVYIPSTSSSVSVALSVKAVTDTADDGTTCDDPPEAACASTCSQADGTFSLAVTGCSTSSATGKIVKGTFTDTFSISCTAVGACAIASDDTKLSATSTSIAVVTGSFDRMEDVLGKLGFGEVDSSGHLKVGTEKFTIFRGGGAIDSELTDTSKYKASTALLTDITEMKKYSIIFINCGTDETLVSSDLSLPVSLSKAVHVHGEKGLEKALPTSVVSNIQTYVQDGGKLYVTDWAYDFIEQAFPQFMDFEGDGSDVSTAETENDAQDGKNAIVSDATVKNATMKSWLSKQTSNTISTASSPNSGFCDTTANGNTTSLNADGSTARIGDFLSGWIVMNAAHTGQSPTVWIDGPVTFTNSSGSEETATRPLTVTQTFGTGKVLYSSYHTAKQCPTAGAWPQERILQYLVFEVAD